MTGSSAADWSRVRRLIFGPPGPKAEADADIQGAGVLGAEDPLDDRQRGVLISGRCSPGAVAYLAEVANHHPGITIEWNRVRLTLSTHSDDGLTAADVVLAGRINALG